MIKFDDSREILAKIPGKFNLTTISHRRIVIGWNALFMATGLLDGQARDRLIDKPPLYAPRVE